MLPTPIVQLPPPYQLATASSPGAIANNLTTALTPTGDSLYVTAAEKSVVTTVTSDLVVPTPVVVAGGAVGSLDYTFAIATNKAAVVTMMIVSTNGGNLAWNLRLNGATASVWGGQKRVGGTGTLGGSGSHGAAISLGTTGATTTLYLNIQIGPVIGAQRLCRTYGVDTGMIIAVESIFLTALGALTSIGIEPASAGNYVGNGSTIFGNLGTINAHGV